MAAWPDTIVSLHCAWQLRPNGTIVNADIAALRDDPGRFDVITLEGDLKLEMEGK